MDEIMNENDPRFVRDLNFQPREKWAGHWRRGRLYPLYNVVENNGSFFVSQSGKTKAEPYVVYNETTGEFSANEGWKLKQLSADSRISAQGGGGGGGVTPEQVREMIAGKQDVISDLATIRSGAAAGASAYKKPNGGIPKSDLSSAVKASLDNADLVDAKQDTLVSGTNIKTVGGQSILGSGDIPVGTQDAVKYSSQELTEEQKQQARSNIGAVAASALSALETAIAAKYSKPSGGIPETDLASAVQSALALARTSIQSLADYYSKTEVDALLDAVGSEQYVDVTTLPTASASTLGKIYLIGPDANGFYDRYYTSYDGSTYSWVAAGNTEINLANYATKEEVSQLQQEVYDKFHAPDTEVDGFGNGYYNTYATTLPTGRNTLNGCQSAKITVTPGQSFKMYGEALNNDYYRFYAFYNSNGERIFRYASSGIYRDTPLDVAVPANAVTMVVNLGNYASATDKVIILGEEYSFPEVIDGIDQANEDIETLTTQVEGVETKTNLLESAIIEGASVLLRGTSASNLVLNNAIELSQDGDTLEIEVEDIGETESTGFSFSNSGVNSNSYYAVELSCGVYGIRAVDGTWLCQAVVLSYNTKHTVKIVYSNGNIYSYVDGSLVNTYTGQKTIRVSSFGNGGNGAYGYWSGKIVSVKHNSNVIALNEQTVNDATVTFKYRFVQWTDIAGLDVLPNGILKYDATNKIYDFYSRYGKTNKYFSFRVKLNEDNTDLVYLKEWRLSEGKVWTFEDGEFVEVAQTIFDAENEMAMRFSGTSDYTGGIHGDERIDVSPLSFVKFYADGRLITAEEMQSDFTIECASFCYMQLSTLHETSATSGQFVSGHPIVAYHYKWNTFEDCASKLENVIKMASEQRVTQYHAGMMCVGKGAGLYAILPGMVETPELSGSNTEYNADDLSASRVHLWNPTTGIRCYVDGNMLQGISNTDIQQFTVWDRTTDSKYYRRMIKGSSVAPVFEADEFIRNEQTIKFY